MNGPADHMTFDALDRAIVLASQAGLPLVPQPYHAIAAQLGIAAMDVMHRIERMLASGAIRRIGVVPNHFRIGYPANGMSVWDVDDALVGELGPAVGHLEFVSHCYRRPRRDAWPYNLFAMVHGRDRQEVEFKVAAIARLLGPAARSQDVLYSTKILKKTGLRLKA
jgi:DNA-binding Lrp family transcriptional regulator